MISRRARARECQARWRRRQRIEDPEFSAKQSAAWRQYRYGLSDKDYKALLARQGGVCATCKRQLQLGVDHCHMTRNVRGLLCGNCNRGLGLFHDDPDLLRAAADYLEDSRRDATE